MWNPAIISPTICTIILSTTQTLYIFAIKTKCKIFPCTFHGGMQRDWRYSLTHFNLCTWGEWSSTCPRDFYHWRKEPPVYMKQETWWDPEPVSMFLKRKTSCPYQDSKPGLYIPQPSLTTLHLLLTYFPVKDKMEHSRIGIVSRQRVTAEQVEHRGTQI